jgi:hypothetical protein
MTEEQKQLRERLRKLREEQEYNNEMYLNCVDIDYEHREIKEKLQN